MNVCFFYDKLFKIFKKTPDKDAPQKKRKIGDKQTPFMRKKLNKQITERSNYKNIYLRWSSRENFLAYKNEKRKCNSMTKYAKKAYFWKRAKKKKIDNHFRIQSNPFSLIEESQLMIASLLKKTESLKTTRKK